MNAEKFDELYNKASNILDRNRLEYLISEEVDVEYLRNGDDNFTKLHILCIEELSELIHAITKHMRAIDDIDTFMNLIEEAADVFIVMQYLAEINGITEEQLNKAINVKLDRLERKLDTEGYYE